MFQSIKTNFIYYNPFHRIVHSFIEKLELGKSSSPIENYSSPIHNWLVYHHSFGKSLVNEIISFLNLKKKSIIFDPFCGSGTSLLVSKQLGYFSIGADLLPLSTLVSRAKTNDYDISQVIKFKKYLEMDINIQYHEKPDIALISRAYSQSAWNTIKSYYEFISSQSRGTICDFYLTALLSIVSKFGKFSNDGGFPRYLNRPEYEISNFKQHFFFKCNKMINEIDVNKKQTIKPRIILGDARKISKKKIGSVDAILTSPPYPNRHDYTRVYTSELATCCVDNNESLINLRKNLFRSHIESKPDKNIELLDSIELFKDITYKFQQLKSYDKRIMKMIIGYFQDIDQMLLQFSKILKNNGKAAIVVGNVRYNGIIIPVDEIICEIGKKHGFSFYTGWIIKYRGNSPQQMRDFGKIKMRESVIMLKSDGQC